jgi:hypothetical protein
MGFLQNFISSTSGGEFTALEGTGWKAAAQAAPALLSGYQAIKANIDYGNKVGEIDTLLENRQEISNPYANISNPFANLQVATKAAEIKMEQSDIALANTLDSLRETGAGGATALAQAALQSKKGIASDIERQEVFNQRLQAQGQQRVDLAKAKGEIQTMMLQEKRTEADLTRLQDQADLLKAQQIYSTQSAMSSLGKGLEAVAGGIVPTQISTPPEGTTIGVDPETGLEMSFAPGANPLENIQTSLTRNFGTTSQALLQQDQVSQAAALGAGYGQSMPQGSVSIMDAAYDFAQNPYSIGFPMANNNQPIIQIDPNQ